MDASAPTRINIFEYAIRAHGLAIPQYSQLRRIRNALRSISIKLGPNISHIVRSNVGYARFSRIIGRRRVILIRIFEKIPCVRAIPEVQNLALSTRLAERSVAHTYNALMVFASRAVSTIGGPIALHCGDRMTALSKVCSFYSSVISFTLFGDICERSLPTDLGI